MKQTNAITRPETQADITELPGLTCHIDENNDTSFTIIQLPERSASLKSTQDKIQGNVNISTHSLGSKTPGNPCYNCDICGFMFYKEHVYKKHLALNYHKENLIQRYK